MSCGTQGVLPEAKEDQITSSHEKLGGRPGTNPSQPQKEPPALTSGLQDCDPIVPVV
jgi:hypothetical protein